MSSDLEIAAVEALKMELAERLGSQLFTLREQSLIEYMMVV